MMEQELKLYPPAENPVVTAAIVGISALIGSFVPLIPYMFFSVQGAILPALGLSAVVLFAVGAYKGKISLGNPIKSGLWLAGIGIAAALIGYGVGYALNVLV